MVDCDVANAGAAKTGVVPALLLRHIPAFEGLETLGAVSIPGKWFSSSRLILNSRRRAHRRTAPSGRSDFWILRACRPQLELRISRACLGQSKLWTSQACRACAAAQSCYNKREDRRLFVSAGTARSFARLLPRKSKAKLPALLLAFSSP